MKQIGLIILMILSGCASMQSPPRGEIEHVVLIWLKQPHNEFQQQQMIERSHEFRKIPGVRSVAVGTSLPSDRPVVDASFDVALVIRFDNEQSLREYDQNPIHKKAVAELLQPLAAKFVIYDFTVR